MCSLTPMGAIFVINLGLDRALASTWQSKVNDGCRCHHTASASNNQGAETSGTQGHDHVTTPSCQKEYMWRDRFLMWLIYHTLLPCPAGIASH